MKFRIFGQYPPPPSPPPPETTPTITPEEEMAILMTHMPLPYPEPSFIKRNASMLVAGGGIFLMAVLGLILLAKI